MMRPLGPQAVRAIRKAQIPLLALLLFPLLSFLSLFPSRFLHSFGLFLFSFYSFPFAPEESASRKERREGKVRKNEERKAQRDK